MTEKDTYRAHNLATFPQKYIYKSESLVSGMSEGEIRCGASVVLLFVSFTQKNCTICWRWPWIGTARH